MARVKVKQVDVFTTTPCAGNTIGVVLDGGAFSTEQMQAIAKELNLSEVVFIVSLRPEEKYVEVRSFTATQELHGGSQGLIASIHCLIEAKMLDLETNGVANVSIKIASENIVTEINKSTQFSKVMLHLKPQAYERATQYKADLVRILNVTVTDFDSEFAIQKSSFLLVPMRRLHTIYTMKPNFVKLTNFLLVRNFKGVLVYTTETLERDTSFHSRYFTPYHPLGEEAVTMHAYLPLSSYLFDKGYLKEHNGTSVFVAEQGDEIGRRGRVYGEILLTDGKPEIVKIGGCAVTVMEGELLLPD
jgi:trans-2,3-dihydro-3-hydroxyanthranilate isomerase